MPIDIKTPQDRARPFWTGNQWLSKSSADLFPWGWSAAILKTNYILPNDLLQKVNATDYLNIIIGRLNNDGTLKQITSDNQYYYAEAKDYAGFIASKLNLVMLPSSAGNANNNSQLQVNTTGSNAPMTLPRESVLPPANTVQNPPTGNGTNSSQLQVGTNPPSIQNNLSGSGSTNTNTGSGSTTTNTGSGSTTTNTGSGSNQNSNPLSGITNMFSDMNSTLPILLIVGVGIYFLAKK